MMIANHVRSKQPGICGLGNGKTVKKLPLTKHEDEDLYRELYIDERGGAIILSAAEISLHIPPGALKEKTLISIEVKSEPKCSVMNHTPQASLTPVITCKPDGQIFAMPVEIVIPHCAVFHDAYRHKVTAEFHKGNLDVIKGKVKEDVKCILKEKYCHVYTNHFSDIKLFISDTEKKRFRMVAFRGASSLNVLLLRVWLINDLPSEYMLLQREHKGCDFVPFDNYDTFVLDYQLQYLMECKTSFQGNRVNPFNEEKTLNNEMLFCTSRNCLEFCVDKRNENRDLNRISISILQNSPREVVCCLHQKVLHTTEADGPQEDRLSQPSESLASSFEKKDSTIVRMKQLLGVWERIIIEILNSSLSEVSNEPIFSKELITLLYNIADNAESNRKKKNIGVIAGSATGIVSTGLTLAGFFLLPATFGVSSGLVAAGIAGGVASASVNLGFTIDKWKNDKKRKQEVEEKLRDFTKFHKDLIEVATLLFVCKDLVEIIKEKIRTHPHQIKLLKEKDILCLLDQMEKIYRKPSARHVFQFLDDIKQQSEALKQNFQIVGNKTDTTEIEMMFRAIEEKPADTFASYAWEIHVFPHKNEKTFINFTKQYFELQTTEEGGKTLFKAGIKEMNVVARKDAVVSSMTVTTSDFASLGAVTVSTFSAFAAVSTVYGTIGLPFSFGLLGHAIHDLVKSEGEKEIFSQSLIDLGNMMEKINNIQR